MQKDLKVLYKEKVVPTMIKDFGYKNIQQVPKITKISLNRGFASGSKKF
jgi:large subunit ribosomal protein L5